MLRPTARRLAALILGATLTLGAAPARAGHERHGGFDRPGGPAPEAMGLLGPHAERLGLSEEVRGRIRTYVEEARVEAERLRKQSDEARGEMHRLLSSPEVDEDAVMRQAEVIGAIELEEHKSRLRAMLRIRSLLTPEQRKELVAIREEMFAKVFENTREACRSDIGALCGDAEGDTATRECMRRRRAELSAPCREAIAAELAKRKPRP